MIKIKAYLLRADIIIYTSSSAVLPPLLKKMRVWWKRNGSSLCRLWMWWREVVGGVSWFSPER